MAFVFDETDLAPKQEDVSFAGQSFVVVEAGADAYRQYQNCLSAGARLEDGKLQLGKTADADLLLLSLCMYETMDDVINGIKTKVLKPVTVPFVRGLLHRVSQQLIDWIKKVSNIGQEKPKQVKLEEQFKKTVADLMSLSESTDDRQAWREWMQQEVQEAYDTVPNRGPDEVAGKNLQSNGTPTSTSLSL